MVRIVSYVFFFIESHVLFINSRWQCLVKMYISTKLFQTHQSLLYRKTCGCCIIFCEIQIYCQQALWKRFRKKDHTNLSIASICKSEKTRMMKAMTEQVKTCQTFHSGQDKSEIHAANWAECKQTCFSPQIQWEKGLYCLAQCALFSQ